MEMPLLVYGGGMRSVDHGHQNDHETWYQVKQAVAGVLKRLQNL